MVLFDSYVMVDWSAAAVPVRDADSIWFAELAREGRSIRVRSLENPPTRAEATARLAARLAERVAAGRRVLVGFDFPFGYPAGTARALGLAGMPWRATWRELSRLIEDRPDNWNNRFDVGEALNRRISGEAFPFWGHGTKRDRPYLCRRGRRGHGPGDLAERRIAELRVRRTQPVWKLAYTGSVGSQMLTGIPRVHELRHHPRLAGVSAIWPFETGLRPAPEAQVVLAEVYPSIFTPETIANRPKDAGQVAAAARSFAHLDTAGALAPLFAGDPTLSAAERRWVEREEAWILGVRARPVSMADARAGATIDYLREPARITRRSYAMVRAETDLGGLPRSLRGVAIRLVHACGMPDIVPALAFSPGVAARARRALADGAPVLVDAEMVRHGITAPALRADGRVICTLGERVTARRAAESGSTRAAAAVALWRPHLGGAVVAIGNAPTALFRLLELLDEGGPLPAAILAFPVGFVGAAESKAELARAPRGVPYLTLHGRRGGSALAAAAVNALAPALR